MSTLDKFSRLMARCAIHEAQIRADPVPFIQKADDLNYKLHRAIEESIAALQGLDDFDICQTDFPDIPMGVVETALSRNDKAIKILREVLK